MYKYPTRMASEGTAICQRWNFQHAVGGLVGETCSHKMSQAVGVQIFQLHGFLLSGYVSSGGR